ncbi:zwei Ig domain protein zig-8-like isoform X2 [Diachasmimorpha longicaudata]|uniref:zwei Ig domain protein zig-8-like isoform X2 n=1 Tax=Diachasmimorpha longicaudata TaxID=58733 RepID=UPI0030B8761E
MSRCLKTLGSFLYSSKQPPTSQHSLDKLFIYRVVSETWVIKWYWMVKAIGSLVLKQTLPMDRTHVPVSRYSRYTIQFCAIPFVELHEVGVVQVSWMRSKDLHILTSSEFTFSSDSRFTPEHVPESDAWTLRLLEAKKTDSGGYECQVNTEPKIMYKVELTVRDPDKPEGDDAPYSQQTRISYESTAPVAVIMGPREQHVPSGSTITLRCVITSPYQTRPIRGVQWLRDNKLLTFQAGRGGIIIETERDAGRTVSEATLAAVTKEDVGKYTCRPTEGRADSIALVIEQGEYTEAMQRDAEYVSSGCELNKEHFVLLLFGGIMTLRKF